MKFNAIDAGLTHLAIIMDGNGRWAKEKGKARIFGHEKGAKTLRKIIQKSSDEKIKHLSVFAFSTENWNRPKAEVSGLMNLLLKFCKSEAKNLADNNCKIKFVGNIDTMPSKQKKAMLEIEKKLEKMTGMQFNVFINYGSRNEILSAVKKIISKNIELDDIDEDTISQNLQTVNIPDPDLIIRTSGEIRISNFMLWQASYSEFMFVDKYWPDFSEEDIDKAIQEFAKRKRRFGKVT